MYKQLTLDVEEEGCEDVLHVADQATDVFAAFLFYVEGQLFIHKSAHEKLRSIPRCAPSGDPVASGLTLAFVLAPGFFVFLCELKRMCCGKSNIFKAAGYLLLSPLWAIVIHLYR